MTVHDRLLQLYRKTIPPFLGDGRVAKLLAGHDGPFLMDCLEEEHYMNARFRLLFVGQQTNHYDAIAALNAHPDPVEYCMRCYRGEQLGTAHRNLPLFNFMHQLHEQLNGKSAPLGFLWTNLWKYERRFNSSPDAALQEDLVDRLNIFPQEVAACSPCAVVFLTGPDNDDAIRRMFTCVTFNPVPGHDHDELSRLSHDALPTKSFRSYHPGYLRRSKKDNIVRETLAALVRE